MSSAAARLAYTVAEAAELIGATKYWLSEAVRSGDVDHVRLSPKEIRFTPAQITALLEARTVRANPAATPLGGEVIPIPAARPRRRPA